MSKIKKKDKRQGVSQSIHLQSYRMAFDGMRAYHTSELHHKRDSINILNGFLASMIPVFGGVVYYILFNKSSCFISWLMIAGASFIYYYSIYVVLKTTKEKLKSDNDSYVQWKNEAIAERKALKLDSSIQDSIKESNGDGYWDKEKNNGLGYIKTFEIIRRYGYLLMGIATLFLAFSFFLLIQEGVEELVSKLPKFIKQIFCSN